MGSGPWGNVELLTLTLSFPSNGKPYETLEKYRFYLSLDPPCIRRIVAGTLDRTLPPNRCGGRWGDRTLIVKQQTGITFDVLVDTNKGKGASQFGFYCPCASVPLALLKNAFYKTEMLPTVMPGLFLQQLAMKLPDLTLSGLKTPSIL